VCAQNHDQIGNRARGERLSMLLDVPRLKAVAALTLLSPFVPMLFQGEEWGAHTPFLYFTDHQDASLARAVTEGRTREFASFGWAGEVPDPQALESFERSKLDWSEMTQPTHSELLDWHRRLIALRASRSPAPGRAKPRVKFDENARWLRVEHAGLAALFNLGDAPRRIRLPSGSWELVLDSASGGADLPSVTGGAVRIPGYGTSIYRKRVDL
jgi:maltooligosyltrehalose trehalohydrolase